ncbi:MAG: hypothetical protein H0V37_04090 [Chloroflexia bacterium]|nr:hypothetical protein [Chloroflexia bacterium]
MAIGKSAIGNLVRSAGIGVASGYLSQSGTAIVLAVTPPQQLPARLRSPWVRRLALASVAGEMVANAHFSFLPSRKVPALLAGRIAFGAANAALLAVSRDRQPWVPAAIGGVYAALGASFASDSRAVLARHVPDPLVGWAENGLAVGLAAIATRT